MPMPNFRSPLTMHLIRSERYRGGAPIGNDKKAQTTIRGRAR